MNFGPLHIRAHLRTGVICNDKFLPLDSVLFYQACRKKYGHQISTVPNKKSIPDVDLPIEKYGVDGNQWYYRCSWADWPEETGRDRSFFCKRTRFSKIGLVDFGKKKGTVPISEGRFKAYAKNPFYRVATHVDWYCVGDMSLIKELLCHTTNLGKNTGSGWGDIIKWDINSVDDDFSVTKEGRLMRGLPINQIDSNIDYNRAYYGIRPVYWLKSNQMFLGVPL